ncbi:cell wall protein DAN4 [Folsomia candida]|uniref:Ejaculatory bulb-specific protein 3 n=1 Tax=Folsomia candida TaxID=158441 RepID=A0A226ELA9_FOLCA|nr:cell wall protein DAN4 [Folsomia candida]OXA58249.1 Ejaculatory bulb-specific protein 3 [Folsomia candida]
MALKLSLFAVMAIIILGAESRPQLPQIPREFQNINFEQYLRNERAMKFQLKCIIYNGPCDTIGKFIKRNIPIYLRTQCKNCDEDQKKLAGKFILFLQENYPKEWDDALVKYGKNTYTPEEISQFEEELGVKIIRDKNGPTRAPGEKPNIDGLIALTKEGLNAALNTKAPLILGQIGSATTIVVAKGTVPPQLAQYVTSQTTTTASSPTTPVTTTSSSSTPTETAQPLGEGQTDVTSITEDGVTDTTDQAPTTEA